jgi:hypothetical protein
MIQRKLTRGEIAQVEQAKATVATLPHEMCNEETVAVMQYFYHALRHGTTDGKPYVEPQPEIGEGYRLATEADDLRHDRQAWYRGEWANASLRVTVSNTTYRVPIDRIPTDEDAKQRPTVMVRNNERMKWKVVKLIMVAEKAEGIHFPFVTIDSLRPDCWACCRFPYPGELE